MIEARHDVGQRQGQLNFGEFLSRTHAKGIASFHHIFVDQPDAKIGQTDHRHNGIEDNRNAVEPRLTDGKEEDQRDQINEGWQGLQQIQNWDDRLLQSVVFGHGNANWNAEERGYDGTDQYDREGLHRRFKMINKGEKRKAESIKKQYRKRARGEPHRHQDDGHNQEPRGCHEQIECAIEHP